MNIIYSFTLLSLLLFVCTSCYKDDKPLPQVRIVLDLTSSEYESLDAVGHTMQIQGIIVVHVRQNVFVAVGATCSYEGTGLIYDGSRQVFVCPNCGSTFDLKGEVLKGPTKINAIKYHTFLYGYGANLQLLIYN